MKTNFSIPSIRQGLSGVLFSTGILLWGVSAAGAQTAKPWTLADDVANGYQWTMCTDLAGRLFVAGDVWDGVRLRGCITRSDNQGSTWTTTVHDDLESYQGIAAATIQVPATSTASAVTEDQLVVSGSFKGHWITRRSLDAGVTWEIVDDFLHPSPSLYMPYVTGVSIDSAGNCYVVGSHYKKVDGITSSVGYWLIRKIARGATLAGEAGKTTIDLFDTAVGNRSHPNGVVCVGTDVFVAGKTADRWQVRRNTGGASTWTVVDDFRVDPANISEAFGITADPAGNVYVAGLGDKKVTTVVSKKVTTFITNFWIVRKGSGMGTGTFNTVDQFQLQKDYGAKAFGISADSAGGIHVTGFARAVVGRAVESHWVTRRYTPTTGWATTDNFAPFNVGVASGWNIAADPFGNVFAAGTQGTDAAGEHKWVVRRQLAPAP